VPSEVLLGGVIVVALMLYVVLAGADFGGGVWDLLAFGPRRARQRQAIEHAIGPIWEANHVWLILVVVVVFTAFPTAFAALSVALHIPLTFFLIGVVFRGSAFAFRSFIRVDGARLAERSPSREGPGTLPGFPSDVGAGEKGQHRWGWIFSLASLISPLLLGMIVGAIASGRIRVEHGLVTGGFVHPWLAPFPIAVGLYALALCAFLAATYLSVEVADDPELQRDFRVRALASGVAVGACALLAFVLSGDGAPLIRDGLTRRPWTWPLHGVTAVCAIGALAALARARFRLARVLVVIQTAAILAGWVASQYPFLLVPDLTIWNTAAARETRVWLLIFLAAGVPVLVPSLVVLLRIFKLSGRGGEKAHGDAQ
jgi:cytochrome d ubiquinol oxidase subunit II